jgi:LPXTG-motif cell wall-anchored protein
MPIFLVGACALILTTLSAPTAAAPTLTLSSATVVAGGSDGVAGRGCAARSTVKLQIDGVALLATTSSATGNYSTHLIIPVSLKPGSHRLTVVCAGPAGNVSTSTSISVNLPRTGSSSTRDTGIAFVLLALGAFLLVANKRQAFARSVPRRSERESAVERNPSR